MRASAEEAQRSIAEHAAAPLQRLYRMAVWMSALRDLRRLRSSVLPEELALHLIDEGWGNPVWSAEPAYLCECYRAARGTQGPILECGSGLTTLVMAEATSDSRAPLLSLEHVPEWEHRVTRQLRRMRLGHARVVLAPLRSYGEYDWYNCDPCELPGPIRLVACDGPPARTRGGRYGLLPVAGDRLGKGCVILLDDYGRPGERAIVESWSGLRRSSVRPMSSARGIAQITIDPGPN